MYNKDLKTYFSFAKKVALNVGKILVKEQEKVKVVRFKDRKDIATSADLASEDFVIHSILKYFPNHGVISEEKGEINTTSDFVWIIDPLDGTKEYVRGIPLWNFSMALEYKGELQVSVVYRPFERSLFSALNGEGSFLNGKKIGVSSSEELQDSFVYCYLPSYHRQKDKYDWAWNFLKEIGKNVYRLRSSSDENSALSWLAQGGIDAYLNLSNTPKWHDIAPGLFIAKQAGALVSDINGKEISKDSFNGIIVANNKHIRDYLLKLINQ